MTGSNLAGLPAPQAFDALLFDLDGTLLDSAPDLLAALNRVAREEGVPALSAEALRPWISLGSAGMLERAFGVRPGDERYPELLARFHAAYEEAPARHSRLYPGARELLARIEALGLAWGIVTNKLTYLGERVLESLGLAGRVHSVVFGDTAPVPKPHPEPVMLICRTLGVAPARALFVGDSPGDIQAGQAAGTATVAALYGYPPRGSDPGAWGADAVLAELRDLDLWLQERTPRAAGGGPGGRGRTQPGRER